MNKDVAAVKNKKHKGASLNARRARKGWIFVLPFVIGLVLIYIPVVIESIGYSFANIHQVAAVQGGGL